MGSISGHDTIVNESEDELKNYHKKFTKYKTTFIENASSLEVQLESIISSYFSKSFDDYILLNHLIFSSPDRTACARGCRAAPHPCRPA